MDGDLGGGGGDVGLANAAGDVDGVKQDAVAFDLRLQGDAGAGGEVHQGRFFVEGVVVLDGLEGEGAVHGSGFEVEEAEAAGEMGGEGALAGAGGAVDGDDGALTFFGGGSVRVLRVFGCPSCGVGVGVIAAAASSGGFTLLRFELAGRGAFAEGLFVALELVEGAGGFAGGACGGFGVGFFAGEAAGFLREAAADLPRSRVCDFAPKLPAGLRGRVAGAF